MSAKKPTNTAQFSLRQLVSAYNTYYRSGYAPTEDSKDKSKKHTKLTFRIYEKEKSDDSVKDALREARKFQIKLSDFEAVSDFKKAYDSGKKNEVDRKIEKDKDGNDKITTMSNDEYLKFLIENHVYDIHLRSCLNIASSGFKLHPRSTKKDKENKDSENDDELPPGDIFYDYLVPQLGFTPRKDISAKDYIDALRSYFESDALRIKGYNKVFPHSIRNQDKKHKGINYVFLQRIVPNYSEILKDVIINEKSDLDIISKYFDGLIKKSKLTKKQVPTTDIIQIILNGLPTIKRTKKSGEEVEEVDNKWISKLVNKSEEAQKIVSGFVRDLMGIKTFVNVVRSSMEAAESPDVIKKSYKEFIDMCETLDRFNTRHEKIENTFESFVKYVLDSQFILSETFGIKTPMKLIASSIKSKVEFKFTRQLKDNFDTLIKAYEARNAGSDKEKEENEKHIQEIISQTAKYCEDNTKSISIVKGYDFLDRSLEIYSNVGRYCGINLPKPYRVAMGIAIVNWINEKIQLFAAANRKREVLIIDIRE